MLLHQFLKMQSFICVQIWILFLFVLFWPILECRSVCFPSEREVYPQHHIRNLATQIVFFVFFLPQLALALSPSLRASPLWLLCSVVSQPNLSLPGQLLHCFLGSPHIVALVLLLHFFFHKIPADPGHLGYFCFKQPVLLKIQRKEIQLNQTLV